MIIGRTTQPLSCMLIPKHSLLSVELCDSSIIQTDKVIHTGVMFLPELASAREMFRNRYKYYEKRGGYEQIHLLNLLAI